MYIQNLIASVIFLFAASSLQDGAANSYCDQHRTEWRKIWKEYEVPCDIAESVIFPELIRYSKFQDKMETGAVRALYVSQGSGACNFSIGRFQMKPSFAEELEKRWMRSGLARRYSLFFDTKDKENSRKVRISRLEKEEWQCIYLAVFLKMLYMDYGSVDRNGQHCQNGLESLSVEEQVRLAATAYNRGCRWSCPGCGNLGEIKSKSRDKHFHTDLIPTSNTRRYVYADLALKHYRRIIKKQRTPLAP